jgi:hypothetical protein
MYGFRSTLPVVHGRLFIVSVVLLAGGASCFVNIHFAHAAVNSYYIANGGSDSNSCTQSSPCATINGVDAKLGSSLPLGSNGTTIHVVAGNYSGPITTNHSGTAGGRITWLSDTKWGAKISNADWQINGQFSDVNEFDLTSLTGWCIGISHNSSPLPHDIHIIGNYCHDVSLSPLQCRVGGAMWEGGTQPTSTTTPPPTFSNWFIGNIIRHVGGSGCSHGSVSGGTTVTITGTNFLLQAAKAILEQDNAGDYRQIGMDARQ